MGGWQSHEREESEEETREASANSNDSGSAASEDAPVELPQCMMGNKKVDDMSFMISCTNWY